MKWAIPLVFNLEIMRKPLAYILERLEIFYIFLNETAVKED